MTFGLKDWVLFDYGKAPSVVLLVLEQFCAAGLLCALKSVFGGLLAYPFFH